MSDHPPFKTSGVATAAILLAATLGAVGLRADVEPLPTWRLNGDVAVSLLHGNRVYVGGPFTQLSTPSSSQDQFYDPITAQVRGQCARSTSDTRELAGVPDGRGGLLVVVRAGDEFADVNGPFTPPFATTIVRIGEDCLWDRGFAAPSIDPAAPFDTSVGIPVPVGGRILAANSVVGPDGFLRAQVAAFDGTNGARLAFQFYAGVAEIAFFGPGPQSAVGRVRGGFDGAYRLAAVAPTTLALTQTQTPLADEGFGARTWIRGTTMFRSRPAPSNVLEAYDLASLAPRAGWTSPAVATLADLELVGTRVFLASGAVGGQTVPQPAALRLDTGAVDATWQPAALTRRVPDGSGTPYVPVLTHLASDGQRLFISGDFERVAGGDRDGVAALSVVTGGLDAWDPAPLVVQPLEYTTGGLLTTRPSGTNRVTRRYLAAIDRATGLATAWNPNDPGRVLQHTPSAVSALAIEGDFLYFASATTGDVLRAALATADVDQNWRLTMRRTGGAPGTITAMTVRGDTLYLSGQFDTISGVTIATTARRGMAAVGFDGLLRPWAPWLDGPAAATLVRAMLPLGPTIVLGGDFTSVNGAFRLGFAGVDAFTGELALPEMYVFGDTRIHGLATDGEEVFVAGESFGAPLVGAVDATTAALVPFTGTGGVAPTSAAFVGGRLYAGREYDVLERAPTERADEWGRVTADATGLLNVVVGGAMVEYFAALPGNPPGAPTLSAAVAGSTVQLSWTPDLEGGAASRYTVFAGSAPGLANLAAFPVRGSTTLTVNAPDGLYFVTVVARNADGASPPSNEVMVRVGPPPCTLPPGAPGLLTHTIAGFAVSLAWGGEPTAAAYRLEAGSVSGASDVGVFTLSNATAVRVSAPAGVYHARVRALSACGVGPPSNEVAIAVTGTVVAPNAPTDLAVEVAGRNVGLSWTPPSTGGTPAGYWLEVGYSPGAANAAAPIAASSFIARDVPPATYYVRIRAYNAAGAGPATPDVVVVVP